MKYSWGIRQVSTTRKQASSEFREEVFCREFEKAINDSHLCGVPMKKMKRFRSAFTTEQVNYLEKEFKKYPYIGNSRRKDVSNVLDIPERAIKIWFQNRRMKEKKDVTNKDLDAEGRSARTETANNQLPNVSDMPSINEPTSLPIITAIEESPEEGNIDMNAVANETSNKSAATPTRSTFYKEVSLGADLVTICQKNNSPIRSPTVINKNSISPKNTAEFSIDLLKKYKLERGENKINNKVKLEKDINEPAQERRNVNQVFSKTDYQKPEFVPISPACAIPQDLSSRKQNIPEFQQHLCSTDITVPIQPMMTGMNANNADVPVYLKGYYTQPYVPPGNMIWKPLNVAPIMSTGLPRVITNNNPASISTLQQQSTTPSGSCTCDCHLKHCPSPMTFQQSTPSPQVHYILTAVPFQSPGTKFV